MAASYVTCLVLWCTILLHDVCSDLNVRDTPSKCQSLRPPMNGLIQCSQNVTKLVCIATCNSGFAFDSGQTSETRTCDDLTGTWINGDTLPLCVRENSTLAPTCPTQNINQFTSVSCMGDGDKLLCTLICITGYKFDSGDDYITKYCDKTTRTWIGGDAFPQCVPDHAQTSCNMSLLPGVNDTDFSASSVWTGVKGYYFGAERARLDSAASLDGKVVKSGGWRPAANTLDQYIQVELNEVTRITGIITKGRDVVGGDTANEYVSKFRVLHSLDGQAWQPYSSVSVSDQFLDGNFDSDTPVMNTFSCPFDALYVRVNPLVWHENIALRFELLGCPPSSGPNKCSEASSSTTTTTESTTTQLKSTTTSPHLCQPLPPPTHGRVNCETTGNQLVCVANCLLGYGFTTGEVLVKRVCFQHNGTWIPEQKFPICLDDHPTPTPPVHSYTNSCLNVQKKCEKIRNGDYQACAACHFFATCSEGYMYVRACPEQLVFDSIKGMCDYHSNTCTGPSAQPIG